jgi:hypothetical protein
MIYASHPPTSGGSPDAATLPLAKRPNYDTEFWIAVDRVFKELVKKHTSDYDGNPGWRK